MNINLGLVVWMLETDRSADMLLKRGLRYVQIAALLVEARDEGLVEVKDGELVPTEAGRVLARASLAALSREGWIRPVRLTVAKGRSRGVYLPSLSKSFFDS